VNPITSTVYILKKGCPNRASYRIGLYEIGNGMVETLSTPWRCS
jgi:hypothetical protein